MTSLSSSSPIYRSLWTRPPRAPEYLSAQESFARENPWYSVHRLEGVSQFPTLEVPDETAAVIREFIR
jgi:hypothetical protein